MAKKNQEAKTLPEAFLKVRDYLWDGRIKNDYQDEMICFAANNACKAGAIFLEHRETIKEIVRQRLYPYSDVRTYLSKVLGVKVEDGNYQQIQDYRHAWLIHLAQEFSEE